MKSESWKRLTEAQIFYEERGYKYIDVPWLVKPETSKITKPDTSCDFYVHDKVLVGSAEQSFLEIYETLDNGLYYAITPCFRDEQVDEWHQQGFMKLELFCKDPSLYLTRLARDAKDFFSLYLKVSIEKTKEGLDVVSNGIELGSYGYRRHTNGIMEEDRWWAYGTGIAEPRLTKAIEYDKIHKN